MFPLPRLFWRLYLSYAVALAVLLVSVAWYLHSVAHVMWEQTQAVALRTAALSAIAGWESNNIPLTSTALQPRLRELGAATGLRLCVVDEKGKTVGDSEVELARLEPTKRTT